MLSRAHTFHGGSTSRFNLPNCRKESPPEPVRLPPIKPSEAGPQQAAGLNNELIRLKAQQTVGCNSKLCFSEARAFPVRKEAKTAISVHPKFLDEPPSGRYYYPGYSPFLMDRDSEQRYFMSGYSGFVPRMRHRLGGTYPVLTHDAMDDFDQARRLHTAAMTGQDTSGAEADAPGKAGHGRLRGRRVEGVIYRRAEGLLPNYNGHIPGHRRRFGQSFGRVTVNARELA